MRRIIFSIIFCFVSILYGENGAIEIFPNPVNGYVASDRVTIKGYLDFSEKVYGIRLKIMNSGGFSYYINQPELAVYPEENESESIFSYFYYIENVPISASGTQINVEKLTVPNFGDFVVSSGNISYRQMDENSSSAYKKSMWGRIANESVAGEPMRGIFYFGGPDNKFYRGFYTRIPQNPLKYLWESSDDVELLFDEMKEAGVNTIKMSYWGDWDENDPVYKKVEYSDRTVVKDRLWMLGDPGFYKLCDFEIRQFTDKCYELVPTESFQAVNTHEMRICDTCSLSECTERATSLNKLNRWREQTQTNRAPYCEQLCVDYEEIPGSCWYISVPKKDGSFWNATIDSREVVFQMALLKDMTVVPVIEDANANFRFSPYFPDKSYILKNRIKKLLEKYGDYESWLEMYDKNGERRKAVFLLQSIYYGNSMTKDLEAEFDKIANEIYLETKCKHKIGFILDTSPLAPTDNDMGTGVPFHNYDDPEGNTYIPQPEKLRKADSFLAINPFNITSDTGLSEDCRFQDDLWSDDAIRLCNSDRWLKYWYEESGLPLIATVVPGFDDRPSRLGYQFYGDSDLWNHIMEKSVRQYNTAGITLDIWNGFTEGYVFVPMVSFFNKWNVTRTGNENYEFAKTLFWKGKNNIYYTDEDQDGVIDSFDNCPDIYNPPKKFSLHTEFVLGGTGSISKKLGFIKAQVLSSLYPLNIPLVIYSYFMQPDSDLDGIGDACDYETSGVDPETGTLGFANSKITDAKGNDWQLNVSPRTLIKWDFNKYATIKLEMPQNSGRELEHCTDRFLPLFNDGWVYMSSSCNAAVHYCAINNMDADSGYWGLRGRCSTAKKEGGSTMPRQNFGYSHGSDDFGQESIRSWRRRISIVESSSDLNLSSLIQEPDPLSQRGIRNGESDPNNDETRKPVKVSNFGGGEAKWNWRKDWYESSDCHTDPTTSLCHSIINGGAYDVNNTMYYALSTSILPVDDNTELEDIPSYIVEVEDSDALETNDDDTDNNIAINDAYFPPTNTNKFARAARYNIGAMELNYHTKMLTPPVSVPIEPPNVELCPSCYYDIPIKFIGMTEIYPYDYVSKYMLAKDFENNVILQSQRLVVPNNLVLSSEITPSEMMGVLSDGNEYFLALNTSNSGADWNKLGVIENWDDNIVSMSLVKTAAANFFIAERRDQTKHLYVIESANDVPQVLNNLNELPELTYTLTDLGVVSVSGDPIKLVYLNGKLYLLEQSAANFKMYSFNGSSFVEIQGTMPPQRSFLNVATTGKYMFLAGGTDFNNAAMTDMWRFDSETDTWTLVTNALQGDFRKVIMQEVDGKMVAFNPVINGNRTFPAFEFSNAELVENITVSYFTIPVPYDELLNGSYCLKETETTLQGGIEISGECVPFTHPWYNSFSAGSTVYSLDGKGERLYVGTNNAIKVYDISDPISPVLVSSFSTNSRVNDLEVYGNTLFAATNSGLYKLDASDPDELTQILFVSAFLNYQYKVEVYNGKLYVGDDSGIKVRDLETMSVLTSVNNGSVLDFAIENGEIGLYKDALFSPVEIRDAETLTLKANEFFGCFKIEVGSSDGRFYLSCDDETYRFEDDGDEGISFTELSGDIRELQDVYTFDGYSYFYDENTIWISTSSDVPAICGNGIVEGDEVCDGTPINCELLDSNYVSGTAACNSTCDGYNTNNCSDDGW